jgi:hypothetical protein
MVLQSSPYRLNRFKDSRRHNLFPKLPVWDQKSSDDKEVSETLFYTRSCFLKPKIHSTRYPRDTDTSLILSVNLIYESSLSALYLSCRTVAMETERPRGFNKFRRKLTNCF